MYSSTVFSTMESTVLKQMLPIFAMLYFTFLTSWYLIYIRMEKKNLFKKDLSPQPDLAQENEWHLRHV